MTDADNGPATKEDMDDALFDIEEEEERDLQAANNGPTTNEDAYSALFDINGFIPVGVPQGWQTVAFLNDDLF